MLSYTEEEILAALPAYVLGALEPDELHFIDQYLRSHPDLQPRVEELDRLAANLALAAPQVAPPPEMKAKVMANARADAERQQRVPASSLSAPSQMTDKAASWMERMQAWWRRSGRVQIPMASAGLMAIVLTAVILTSQLSIQRLTADLAATDKRISQLEAELTDLQDQNASLLSQLNAQTQQVATITEPERTIFLGGTDEMPGARAAFYVRDNMGVLVARGLSMLESDQTYQLWLIPTTGAPQPAGLLGQGTDSGATFAVEIEPANAEFGAVGISIEPAGGSQSPTGPIVLLGEVT